MPTIYNKVTADGETLIDLSNDTVSQASHIVAPYIGHLRDGTQETGTYSGSSPTLQAKTNISPTTSSQTITADSGYDGLSSVQINAMPSMTLPSSASSTSSGTSKATISRSTSNQYINIPTGYNGTASYYTISATQNGTAGTPTATKGTVSNHSVSVTPSVTNTTGYITGSTKTGTAVTVSASELVSGSETKTANGTYDVTNLASLVVNVSSGGSSMNVQAYAGYDSVNVNTYTDTDVTLTVAKSGTYTISWMGWRNTTSGTSGSQLYKNGTAVGNANTSFMNSYGQSVTLTGQSLNQGDVLVVRARARNTSYYMGVGNLIIIQTA